jgi:hypothetical protein
MLGAAQARWFVDAVAGSRARWKIIACDQPVGLIAGRAGLVVSRTLARETDLAIHRVLPISFPGRERAAALASDPGSLAVRARLEPSIAAAGRSSRSTSRYRTTAPHGMPIRGSPAGAARASASSCRTRDPGALRPRNRARRGRLGRWVPIRTYGIRYTRSARMASRPCS